MSDITFRIFFFTVFISTLGISAYFRRRARRSGEAISRLQEGKLALTGRLILGLTLLSFIIAYTFKPEWLAWSTLQLPLWFRWFGVATGLLCPLLAYWIFRNIGENISETVLTKERHRLVTTGPYRWVRHPLYTTGILLILSMGVIAASWIFLLLGAVSIVVFRYIVIPKEEAHLLEKFGERYKKYRKNTGRLLPRLKTSRSNNLSDNS